MVPVLQNYLLLFMLLYLIFAIANNMNKTSKDLIIIQGDQAQPYRPICSRIIWTVSLSPPDHVDDNDDYLLCCHHISPLSPHLPSVTTPPLCHHISPLSPQLPSVTISPCHHISPLSSHLPCYHISPLSSHLPSVTTSPFCHISPLSPHLPSATTYPLCHHISPLSPNLPSVTTSPL